MRALRVCRYSRMDLPNAAPSAGSVPPPNSSNSTKLFSSADERISAILRRWLENVLKLCSMLCSSPMSAVMRENTASSEPSLAGMCIPDCAIKVSRPTVFNVMVLPPVFGPVMIKVLKSPPRRKSMGTTTSMSESSSRCRVNSNGWRATLRLSHPFPFNVGGFIS